MKDYISRKVPANLNELRDTYSNKYYLRNYSELSYWEKIAIDYVVNPITPQENADMYFVDGYDDDDDTVKCYSQLSDALSGTTESRMKAAESYFTHIRKLYNENLRSNIDRYETEYITKTESYLAREYDVTGKVEYVTKYKEVSVPEYSKPNGYYLGGIDFPPEDWDLMNAGYEKCKPVLYSIGKFTPNGYHHPNEIPKEQLHSKKKYNPLSILFWMIIGFIIFCKLWF